MAQEVAIVGQGLPYYSAAASFQLSATPTDFFTITGASDRLVFVRKFVFTMNFAALNQPSVSVIRRTTANTGGTSTVRQGVLHAYPGGLGAPQAAAAVVRSYTVEPAVLGAVTAPLGGTLRTLTRFVDTAAAGGGGLPVWEFDFSAEPVLLRSASDVLALNATAAASGYVEGWVEWQER